MSDADLERDRRLALETAEEAVDFVMARLMARVDAVIDAAPSHAKTGFVRRK